MFCGNCGTENSEGTAFCSNCGKSPSAAAEGKDTKMVNYPLINLSSKLFYPIFEAWLWFNVIACTIGGGIIGNLLSSRRDNYTGIGVFVGLIAGFLTTIISGGLISIFLKINENIGKIEQKK